MKHLLILLTAFLVMTSCQGDEKKLEALQKETNEIHDQAMKDMADMNRVAREIKEFMQTANLSHEDGIKYADVLSAIGTAENNMMSWMANYHEPKDQPTAEAIKYLETQKAFILENQKEIREAAEAGKKLLGK